MLYSILSQAVLDQIRDRNAVNLTYTKETKTTDGTLYLVVLRGGVEYETIEFQFIPDTIPITRGINMNVIKPIGRNLPKYHYSGGETSTSLNLDYYA